LSHPCDLQASAQIKLVYGFKAITQDFLRRVNAKFSVAKSASLKAVHGQLP
jgi:hypothetical protein